MQVIDTSDYERARENWCVYHGVPYDDGTSHPDFNEMFGIKTFYSVMWASNDGLALKVTNQCAKMVRLMSGPYWRTIIKMYEAKRVALISKQDKKK